MNQIDFGDDHGDDPLEGLTREEYAARLVPGLVQLQLAVVQEVMAMERALTQYLQVGTVEALQALVAVMHSISDTLNDANAYRVVFDPAWVPQTAADRPERWADMLADLAQKLGRLLSDLRIDAQNRVPFLEWVAKLGAAARPMHRVFIDAGILDALQNLSLIHI